MSWGQVGRERDDEPAPPTSAFRWVTVGALCLAVVLFAVAFMATERRAAPSRAAAAPAAASSVKPSPRTPRASEPPSPRPSSATESGDGAPVERKLFDFSGGGTQGWEYGGWQKDGPQGEVVPDAPPTQGVRVVSPGGNGWFQAPFAVPADLTGATTLSYDVDGDATDVIVALSVGPQGAWCETKGARSPPGSRTVDVGLASLLDGCFDNAAVPKDLSDVRSIQIWFSRGTFTLGPVWVSG